MHLKFPNRLLSSVSERASCPDPGVSMVSCLNTALGCKVYPIASKSSGLVCLACVWFPRGIRKAAPGRGAGPRPVLAVGAFDLRCVCAVFLLTRADLEKPEVPQDSGFWPLRRH